MKPQVTVIAVLTVLMAMPSTALAQFCVPGVTGTKRFEYDPGTDLMPLPFQIGLAVLQQCGELKAEWLGFSATAGYSHGNSTAGFVLDFDGMAAFNDAIGSMGNFGDLTPGVSVAPCPPVVAEMPILAVGGSVNLYAFHVGAGGYMRWTVQATVTACDTVRVTSPEATMLEVPIKIAGSIVAAESFGDQPTTSARGKLRLAGFFAANTLGPHEVEVESASMFPVNGSILEEGFMYVNVPAGTSEFDYEIVAEFEAEAGAKGTGFWGSIAGSSTIGLLFPDTIRIGNFRGVGGSPLPEGIVIESALNGMRYNAVPDDILGDFDGDGLVTLDDYPVLSACMRGVDDPAPPEGCNPDEFELADVDNDGDVDLADFAAFQAAFGGP